MELCQLKAKYIIRNESWVKFVFFCSLLEAFPELMTTLVWLCVNGSFTTVELWLCRTSWFLPSWKGAKTTPAVLGSNQQCRFKKKNFNKCNSKGGGAKNVDKLPAGVFNWRIFFAPLQKWLLNRRQCHQFSYFSNVRIDLFIRENFGCNETECMKIAFNNSFKNVKTISFFETLTRTSLASVIFLVAKLCQEFSFMLQRKNIKMEKILFKGWNSFVPDFYSRNFCKMSGKAFHFVKQQ